mgnify:CR=1 FL=1
MKKFIVALTCATLLSSCEAIRRNSMNDADVGKEIDIVLANEKNIFKTLYAFKDNYYEAKDNYYKPIDAKSVVLSSNRKQLCCGFFSDYTKKRYCDPNYGVNSRKSCEGLREICEINSEDECILHFRNNKYASEIAYFNYKKYLPEGVADSEQEFLALYEKFRSIFVYGENKALSCGHSHPLTQEEKLQCIEQAKKDFTTWAMSGGAKGQIKLAQAAEQKRKEQQAAAKAKTEAQKADCKQAKEKAQKRLEQIKTALGMKSNEKNIHYSLTGKVVDFADNGIIISTDCSGVWANGWMLGALGTLMAANCEEERTFIYTKNTDYATNEKFNNKGLLYKKAGNFRYTTVTGATMSIPAYRETSYKASEIDYKTYLKDKSIKYCN